jgi:hypothetical protein
MDSLPELPASSAQRMATAFANDIVNALDRLNSIYQLSSTNLSISQEKILNQFPQPREQLQEFEELFLLALCENFVIVPDDKDVSHV